MTTAESRVVLLHHRSGHGALGPAGVGHLVGAGNIRLTSTLVLWLIYGGLSPVLRRFPTARKLQKLAAALAGFEAFRRAAGLFSGIWFFRTQHPQPVKLGGGSMDECSTFL